MGGFALNFDVAKTMSLTSGTAGLNLSSTTAINDTYTTVASATTPDIWTAIGGVITYTGVATATGFAAAPQAGARRMLVCAGASVFTAGANVLIAGVPSGSNYTAAANDVILVTALTTTQFLLDPFKYDGTAARSSVPWAVAGGTADAITATYAPPTGTLVDGQILGFRATAANATPTPTFSPDAGTARTITRGGGTAVLIGDIPGNLAECLLRYNLANTRWELLNPALVLKFTGTLTNPSNTTQALTDQATITWDASLGGVATVTLAGNRTMAAPTNLKTGGRYVLHVTQDATGGRTLAFNAVFKNQGGAATLPVPSPSLSTLTSYVFDSPDGTNLQLVNFYKQPTRQVFITGTAATYTTPIGATRINVRLVGGGGGGGAADTNNGTVGNNTTFSTLTGSGGSLGGTNGAAGGVGGAAAGGDINIPGGGGGAGRSTAGASDNGGLGGNSAFGGGAASTRATAGVNGGVNSGGGGSGGGATNSAGAGGGGGGYCEKLFISPATTYTYTVGAAASGGAAGTNAGGVGAAGIIIVDESYN